MTATNLSSVLGLRPLDRVQINNMKTIREMRLSPQMGFDCDLPFFYFQRVLADGALEVRSPSGYVTSVLPEDICDVVSGKPLVVRAMPENVFLARIRLPLSERQQRPGDECYADAYVLHVWKNKWGRVDQTYVRFVDPALNGERPKNAVIHDDDRQLVAMHARRVTMPVISKHGGYYSADHGLAHERDLARDITSKFILAALHGSKASVDLLSTAGFKKISRAMLNKTLIPVESVHFKQQNV